MTSDRKVEITQVFDAPVQKVWEAWTDIEQMKMWSAPEGMYVPSFEGDLTVGSSYKLQMQSDGSDPQIPQDAGGVVSGTYLEVDPPHKLSYTWLWEGDDEVNRTIVTLLFKEVGSAQTELTLIHSGFTSEESQENHRGGWTSSFMKLALFLKGGD
jgi:uncharacterized protein YndB with AHSA1/START domain